MSTPVVGDNTIYIGSFDRHVYAIDATSGSLVWQFPESDEEEGKPEKWFWANLVNHNEVIYAPCLDGKVYILDAGSGHELVEAIDLESPLSPSPVLVEDSIIIASEDGSVYSLDTDSNQIKPLADVEDKVYAPLSAGNGVLYIHTQEEETIYALDVQTGAELWSLPLSSK
jgi:outer membrane protein assembly factor BamB